MNNIIIDGKSNTRATFLFSHGAGAPMDHPFMAFFAKHLSERGLKVVRFEFDYMALRRQDGKRRLPDHLPKLREQFLRVINSFASDTLIIGGKSMGGRVASIITSENNPSVTGCVCLGYPFHPPNKPSTLRTEHLKEVSSKILICQGERDRLGTIGEVKTYTLSPNIEFFWLKDGDHGFKPRKSSGTTEEENWLEAVEKICTWSQNLT
jgi:predicted alpha/beta-hydrolase family hydrolase